MGKPAKALVRYDKRERFVRSIIRRIQAGDDNALSELLPLYTDLIWEQVFRRFGDRDEDAFSSGMWRLWREARRHKLDCGAKFITLLQRGLVNEMISVWKRRMTPKHKQGTLYDDVFRYGSEEKGNGWASGESHPGEQERNPQDQHVLEGHSRRLSARYLAEDDRDEAA